MAKKIKSKRTNTTLPSARILVACDAVARDPNSKKITLYGLFDLWLVEKLPTTVVFTAFAKLFGGRGSHQLQLEAIGPDGRDVEKQIPALDMTCTSDRFVEVVFQGTLTLRRVGKHILRLKIGRQTISQPCEITVKQQHDGDKT